MKPTQEVSWANVPTAAATLLSTIKKPALPADRKRLAKNSICAITAPPNQSQVPAPTPTGAAANKKATASRRGQLQIANRKSKISRVSSLEYSYSAPRSWDHVPVAQMSPHPA